MGVRTRLLGLRRRAGYLGLTFFALSALGGTCSNTPPPNPPPVISDDAGPAADMCEASCRNQRLLQCKGASGKDTPNGKHCEDVCRSQDSTFDLHSECVAKAKDCDALLACFKKN
jgi:hypothetical protein